MAQAWSPNRVGSSRAPGECMQKQSTAPGLARMEACAHAHQVEEAVADALARQRPRAAAQDDGRHLGVRHQQLGGGGGKDKGRGLDHGCARRHRGRQ